MQSYDSLSQIQHDQLAELVGGRFRLTRLISMRLREIMGGAPLLVERHPHEALLSVVCREIEAGLISLDVPEIQLEEQESDMDLLGIENL